MRAVGSRNPPLSVANAMLAVAGRPLHANRDYAAKAPNSRKRAETPRR